MSGPDPAQYNGFAEEYEAHAAVAPYNVLYDRPATLRLTHHPTEDWRRLGGSYFDVATVTETWSTGWEITTWRMPLTQMTEEFAAAGFVIERLIEPIPEPAMQATHPDTFARLSRQPGFVLFRLIRRS